MAGSVEGEHAAENQQLLQAVHGGGEVGQGHDVPVHLPAVQWVW